VSVFSLKSVHDAYCLTLSPQGQRGYRAVLSGPDLNAETTIYDVTGETFAFADFWRGLASHWKGWSGAKSWASLEGDLELEARSDSLGHIEVTCALSRGAPHGWRIKVWLFAEAGALDALASQAASFCEALCPSVARERR
jgi:hypothetical protein